MMTDSNTTNIAPRRLHEQVLTALIERIVGGEFAPGAGLPSEAEMCETYGVSRSSVREALRVLAEKGLIEVRHGLGTRVNPPERWDFLDALVIGARRRVGGMAAVARDLLEAVRIVECEAAALAAERSDEGHRTQMEGALEDMQRTNGDPQQLVDAAYAFHHALLQATGNYVLMRMGEPIRELLHYSISETMPLDGTLERIVRDHQAISRAICAGDAAAARDAMRVHLETTARELTGKIGQANVA